MPCGGDEGRPVPDHADGVPGDPMQTSRGSGFMGAGGCVLPRSFLVGEEAGVPATDGCNRLPFTPSIRVTPDGQAGSTPTGLTVDEHVPQEVELNPTGLAESEVKGLSVTLPEGVALNPAGADGLQACTHEEIGLQSAEAISCPEASKVGTVRIRTPLLPNPLEGAAYLATQNTNPFGSLVAMYIFAEDPMSGVRAKATGEVVENPVTGQLTAHFEGDPLFENDPVYAGESAAQFLPRDAVRRRRTALLRRGPRAVGDPGAVRGVHDDGDVHAVVGEAATTESSSEFEISSGPNGTPVPGPAAVQPVPDGGHDEHPGGWVQAVRDDDEPRRRQQNLQGIQLKMPLGMLGTLRA